MGTVLLTSLSMPATSLRWRWPALALTIATALLFGVSLSSCGAGSTGQTAPPRGSAPGPSRSRAEADGFVDGDGYVRGDRDEDALGRAVRDSDDAYVRDYGVAGSASQRQAVASIVRRYFKAAAAGDARRACAVLAPSIAHGSSFSRFVPRAYSSLAHSSLFVHRTCEQVEALMFELGHEHLVAGASMVQIPVLRIRGRHGIALLAFKTLPERHIEVELSHGRWTIDTLLDEELI
jgi:hypothetical protein